MTNRIDNLRQALLLFLMASFVFCSSVDGQEGSSPESHSSEYVSTTNHAKEPSRKSIQKISDKIDALVKQKLSSEGLQRNKRTNDSVFVRRVYLDIIGRIPGLEETQAFLTSKNKSKREDLIDELLDSYGRTSRQFNFWADLLRITSQMGNGLSGQPYIDFIKDSLERNKPYDEFVQELLTASGANLATGNGSVGYYLRDRNMPEDNMSNTVRIFLGTRLECAQCHDHPYDDWTQRQYFEMVAFTGGVNYRAEKDRAKDYKNLIRDAEVPEKMYVKVKQYLRSLNMGVSGSGSGLARLPENFLGDDGEDGEIVVAREMFNGEALTDAKVPDVSNSRKRKKRRVNIRQGVGSREIYAAWLTDPDNPRFATVIANRLWKQAMGVGLIEPVDIIEEGTEGSNPELMKYLAETMVKLDFDMKQFQRAIFMSETYQASAFTKDVPDATKYSFQGPVVRRMSAEQIWDSLLTLMVTETDTRRTDTGYDSVTSEMQYEEIMNMSPPEILKYVVQVVKNRGKEKSSQKASQKKRKQKIKAKQNEIKKLLKAAQQANDTAAIRKLLTQRSKLMIQYRQTQPRFTRASELPSPAPANHFLREFGQSDRRVIDNANLEPSVPQVLSMMNGMLEQNICRDPNSVLMQQAVQAGNSQECIEMVFLTMLSRKPNRKELKAWLPDFDAAVSQRQNAMVDTFSDLIWTIANSNEFIFQK